MATQKVHISYWDKEYLDSQFPKRENVSYFQLAIGHMGASMAISRPEDFPNLCLNVLEYLKKPTSLKNTYQIEINEDAFIKIGETGRKVLEEILALHNDFVNPKRS